MQKETFSNCILKKFIKNAIKYTLHLSDLWSFYTMLVNLHNFLSIQEEKLVKSKEKRWWYLLLHFYGFAKLKNEIWEEWFILQVLGASFCTFAGCYRISTKIRETAKSWHGASEVSKYCCIISQALLISLIDSHEKLIAKCLPNCYYLPLWISLLQSILLIVLCNF